MKQKRLFILLLFMICLLSGCGLFSLSSDSVSGKYYLAVRPDPRPYKNEQNTVKDITDETLRLQVGGRLIRTVLGEETEGSWEIERKRIRLTLGESILEGRIEDDTIRLGEAVYVRGKAAAQLRWEEDAAAFAADPLGPYRGKYYLAGYLEDGENRVKKTDAVTLRLLEDHAALLSQNGETEVLSWDVNNGRIVLKRAEEQIDLDYAEECLTGRVSGAEVVLMQDPERAAAYLAEHPFVQRPYVPQYSGLEGSYYLGYATAFGQTVDIGAAGAITLNLMPDYLLTCEGPGYTDDGEYSLSEDGVLWVRFASGYFEGRVQDGRLDMRDSYHDSFLFFADKDEAEACRLAHLPPVPDGPSESPTAKETDPVPDSTEEDRESSPADQPTGTDRAAEIDFWKGTWYGVVRLTDRCSGLYRMMQGKCYTVYVTLSVEEDGTGTLVAYDPAETFAERLLSGRIRCEGLHAILLESGEIEPFHAALPPYRAEYDTARNLVSFRLEQKVSGGTIGGELLLRRWGERWEDVPELLALLPDYESYLKEIASGVPRYTAD